MFYTVSKLTKNNNSPRKDGFHFSSYKFINFFDEKMMIIKKLIININENSHGL
jgi:hypothetical protein